MLLRIPEYLFQRSVQTLSRAWSRHAVGPKCNRSLQVRPSMFNAITHPLPFRFPSDVEDWLVKQNW